MRRILHPLLLTAAAAALLLPAGARAGVTIGSLDTTDYPTLRVSAVTSASVATPPTLRENGHKVEGLVAQSLGARRALAIAIDRSHSMSGAPLADAIAAARVFLRTKNEDDEVALFSFSSRADQLTGFSNDPRDVAAALGGLRADTQSGTALYDTVVDAADALARDDLPGRVLILVTDGHNASSSGTLDNAIAAARDVGVTVYPIGISSGSQFSPASLQRLAAATGGAYSAASPSSALVKVSHDLVQRLARTWELTYKTTVPPGERARLALTQPGAGAAQRTFVVPRDAGRPPRESIFSKFFFHSVLGNVIAAMFIGLFVLFGVMHLLGARNIRRVQRRLEPHVPSAEGAGAEQEKHRRRFAFLGGLFSATDHAFGRFSAWRKLRAALEQADSPLRPAEFFYIMVGAGAIIALVLLMLGLPGFVALLGFLIGSVVPYAILARKGSQRQKAFDEQLPDLLMTMGASLRAGHTFRQSMQACVREAKEPASKEFRHVLLETGLGRPMDMALMDASRRLGSTNFDYVISVVSIQNEVGGSLANLFDMVSDAVRQRQQFAKKVRALTSMGRTSAYVLCGLPFFLLVVLSIINYQYMKPIFTTSTGKVLLVIALIGMAIGGVILRKIVSFRMS